MRRWMNRFGKCQQDGKISMNRNSLVLCFFVCLFFSASAQAQYACTPGDFPPLSDPFELEITETQPFPGTAMVPGMQVISAGGIVALMDAPSGKSEQCGELNPDVQRHILGMAIDETGEIWYMLRGNEEASRRVWCPGSALVPDRKHMTDVPFLVWLASGFAFNGQLGMAHRLVENFDGIGTISDEEDDVLIAIYNPTYPVTNDCEEMYWLED